jgi:hypothetical protein
MNFYGEKDNLFLLKSIACGGVEPITSIRVKFDNLAWVMGINVSTSWSRFVARLAGVRVLTIHCCWDDEAKVWYVADSDVPGLSGEAATVEEMSALLKDRIPELLALNERPETLRNEREVPWKLVAERSERIAVAF